MNTSNRALRRMTNGLFDGGPYLGRGRSRVRLGFKQLCHGGDVVIHGYPHPDEAGSWREVWIEVTPVYEIDRLVITGVDGSQNDIRLDNIRPNVRLNKDLFDFKPPAGVRVVPAA